MNTTPVSRYEANQVARMVVSRMVHEVTAGLTQEQVESVMAAKAKLNEAQQELNTAIFECIKSNRKY
jgi:hypothetical protein